MKRRAGHSLIRVSAKLGKVPSFAFACLYLLLIPCFALLYTWMAADFFHSTVQYEESLGGEADQLINGIESSVRDSFRRVHGSDVARENGWWLNVRRIAFGGLRVEGDSISFYFQVESFSTDSLPIQEIYNTRIVTPVRPTYGRWDPKTKSWTNFRELKLHRQPAARIAGRSAPPLGTYFRDPRAPSDSLWLVTSNELTQEIMNFAAATRGFPSRVSGRFERMFYLSTATITTLGYGDIVPLTTRSRLVVSLEAILGIIVAGLFLNSLARESGDGRADDTLPPTDSIPRHLEPPNDQ